MNENPAFGAGLQPFMGITSFMRLPVSRDLQDVDVAILGVPFDSGTSYRTGTRFGPRKIRETSLLIWGHNSTLNVSPLKKLKVVDYGDVSVIPTSIEHTMIAITTTASEIINQGTTLITMGGDSCNQAIALSTSNSVSGRGIKTSRVTSKRKPKNSQCPRM